MTELASPSTGTTVWFLVGPLDQGETVRHVPLYTFPFQVGRRQELALSVASKAVSGLHAELFEVAGNLVLRDLGSTNGTYLNGQPVTAPIPVGEDDLIQFADLAFRVRRQAAANETHTVRENLCDRAMALVQFDKLMAGRAATPFFQPIVRLDSQEIQAFEVLGRSKLFGLESPYDMFRVAAQLNLEAELSRMLRWEGISAGLALGEPIHLFVNTHPRELTDGALLNDLAELRKSFPEPALTLEIHESAVTDVAQVARLKAELGALHIRLAYDDFGAGQSRLNELAACPPDCVKFDMSLIRGIDAGNVQRQQLLESLVRMVHDLGVVTLAEGVETAGEHQVCRELGFELGQGYHYGRPAPAQRRSGPL